MTDVRDDIERQVSRFLDGELDENEAADLQRELLRNPDARRMYEDLERIDRWSSAALKQAVAGRRDTNNSPGAARRGRRGPGLAWLVTGAIAASLAALVIPRPQPWGLETPSPRQADQSRAGSASTSPSSGLFQNVSHGVDVPTTRRRVGREIFGVVGEDGNVYWIEVDRTRTIRLTPPSTAPWSAQPM